MPAQLEGTNAEQSPCHLQPWHMERQHTSYHPPSPIMYDHQSQAPSTHHAPFNAWFKKALRLNRDPVLFLPFDDIPGASKEDILVTAAIEACCCLGVLLLSYEYTLRLVDENRAKNSIRLPKKFVVRKLRPVKVRSERSRKELCTTQTPAPTYASHQQGSPLSRTSARRTASALSAK
jgi:hypothetical protein